MAASTAPAQVQIKGRVIDAVTQKPLVKAKIQAQYLPLETNTNSFGVFEFSGLPSGELELKVSCTGYAFVTLKVNLKTPVTTLMIRLEEEQLPPLSPLLSELNRYREKVFVVTDKPYYYPGEIIWTKAFLNQLDSTKKDSLSRVLYLELINKQSQVWARQVLSLDSGRLAGSIILPDDLPSGNYILRAYTRFMYNFGTNHFFYKSIPVLNLTERALPFSDTAAPVSEGYVIQTNLNSYGLRQRVDVTLQNLPQGNYAIAVTDLTQVARIPEATIRQNWYLDKSIDKEPPVSIDQIVEKGVRFTGQFVSEYKTGKQVTLSLMREDMSEALEFLTDEKGWFQVNGLKFYDSITYFYKAKRGKKGSEFYGRIQLEKETDDVLNLIVPGYWFNTESAQSTQRMLADYLAPPEVKMLEEVEVRANRFENSQQKGIRGGADKIVKAEGLLNFGNLLLSLQGKIPGLLINCASNPCEIRFSRAGSISTSTEPLVLINDVPVGGSAATVLQNLDINMVDRIEVSRKMNVLYGEQGRNGIIAVYLKEGFNRFSRPEDTTPTIELRGFNRPLTFVSPDYKSIVQDQTVSDYRSTLYWNPELKYEGPKGYGATFFTSDMPGNYRIVLQGVTNQNQPVYLEKIISVSN